MTPTSSRAAIEAHLIEMLSPSVLARVRTALDSYRAAEERSHNELRLVLRSAIRSELDSVSGAAVHAAACVLSDGRGLLLPGRSRAGKSTLALALSVERSAAIVSDDGVLLAGRHASGSGGPVAVRVGSPYWQSARALWYADDSDRLLVRPDDLGGPMTAWGADVDLVAFPHFGRSPAWGPLQPAAAFCMLATCLIHPVQLPRLMELARFVSAVRCAEVSYRSVPEAIDVIDAFIAEAGPSPALCPAELTSSELSDLPSEVFGIRFGDEVVLVHRARGELVHLRDWPEGAKASLGTWSTLMRGVADASG